ARERHGAHGERHCSARAGLWDRARVRAAWRSAERADACRRCADRRRSGHGDAACEPCDGWLAAAEPVASGLPSGIAPRMQIGIIGLGRMGGNMARRLRRGGVEVIGFDADPATGASLAKEGIIESAESIVALARRLAQPRVVWLMVPAGHVTELTVQDLW